MSRFNRTFSALVLAAIGAHAAPAAAACEAKSGDATVALLELYTSEGCSSCPPADRWVADLPKGGYGKNRVVPLAFHVDYWDYIGWADPFAQKAFTERQQEFARRTRAATIYTPQLILSGRDYRRSWLSNFSKQLDRINASTPRADIALRWEGTGNTVRLHGEAAKKTTAPVEFFVAVYENNLSNEIAAGENSGKTLHHDYVIRRLYGPLPFDGDGRASFVEKLALDPRWKTADLGVAAFVQESRGTEVLQALALDACS